MTLEVFLSQNKGRFPKDLPNPDPAVYKSMKVVKELAVEAVEQGCLPARIKPMAAELSVVAYMYKVLRITRPPTLSRKQKDAAHTKAKAERLAAVEKASQERASEKKAPAKKKAAAKKKASKKKAGKKKASMKKAKK